jgi:hypothetical protein
MSICSTAAPDPRKRPILVTDGGLRPIFVPVLKGFKALGIGSTQGWGLVKQGKIKTVVRNGRRLADVNSIEELAEEWLADESPPPRKGLAEATAASLASRRRGQNEPAAAATPPTAPHAPHKRSRATKVRPDGTTHHGADVAEPIDPSRKSSPIRKALRLDPIVEGRILKNELPEKSLRGKSDDRSNQSMS